MNKIDKMVFGGECNNCQKNLKTTVKPTTELMSGETYIRVFCANCRTINRCSQVDMS